MAMPYGKYKGKELFEIPSSYIHWMAENWEGKELCEAADREWQWREKMNKHWED